MNHASHRRLEAPFTATFFAAAAATCLLVAILPGSIPYRLVKIVPLSLLCLARLRDREGRLASFVGLGFAASLVGDAVIDSVFVAGLAAFLVGHLFYLAGMGLPAKASGAVLPALPALLVGGSMWVILVASGRAPAALHAPITAYALIISSMLGRALGRAFVEPADRAARIFSAGAALFVISDSLIGINRWVFPMPLGRVWILSTYFLGQFLIFKGSAPQRRVAGDQP
jgi:uncharacterized membrane protein YhhN